MSLPLPTLTLRNLSFYLVVRDEYLGNQSKGISKLLAACLGYT